MPVALKRRELIGGNRPRDRRNCYARAPGPMSQAGPSSDRVKAAASARYETKVTMAKTKCDNDCENARKELMRALDRLEAEHRAKLLWCAVAEAKATALAASLPLPCNYGSARPIAGFRCG
jgi:hypothetical protein